MAYAVQTTPAWQAPSLPPFLQDFLTFRGRMNRARYWGAVLSLVCIAIRHARITACRERLHLASEQYRGQDTAT